MTSITLTSRDLASLIQDREIITKSGSVEVKIILEGTNFDEIRSILSDAESREVIVTPRVPPQVARPITLDATLEAAP